MHVALCARGEAGLLHPVRLAELALAALQAGRDPNLLFVASIASVMTQRPPTEEACGPMKDALVNYTGQLAARHGASGLRANAVSPGTILHAGGEWDCIRAAKPALFAMASKLPAMGRLVAPEAVAKAVVFLCSPAASDICQAFFNLEAAVGRTRVGCAAGCWQGATTLRPDGREDEQRGQRPVARLSRVCSATTQKVKRVVAKNSMFLRCYLRWKAVNCRF